MALKMTDRMVDGVAVEAMEGRIVLGEESTALREKVKTLLGSGKKKIVLDMANVSYIDSSGLGALVAATPAQAQDSTGSAPTIGVATDAADNLAFVASYCGSLPSSNRERAHASARHGCRGRW